MATLKAMIQDPAHVAEAVAAMGNPDCGYKTIYFREYAKQEVGEKGNQAVRNHIARALENCRVKNVHITFTCCNLDQASVQLLANAVEKNTCIGGFTCMENPFNFPDGRNYDPSTDEPVKRAIIASKAPITKWNWKELPQDMVEARRQRAAAATVAVPPSAPSLDTLPTLQDFALAQEEHAKEEQVLTECQAKLEADTKELEETRALLVQLQARSATLERGIAQTAVRVQAAKANIAKHVHVFDTVEAIRKCADSLAVAPPPNNLCGVCFEREKNRTFYKCGHQCCSSCADAIMRVKKECPYCRMAILDVIPVFN